jgi:hypothetical protein
MSACIFCSSAVIDLHLISCTTCDLEWSIN